MTKEQLKLKKQYDRNATYHSKHFGRIVTVYLGTLFFGKCTADDLLCHLNEMLDKLKLSLVCIISLGMDGPSVNLFFKQKLETTLQGCDKVLIDVGTCPLHIVSNAFREGLKILSADFHIDLDQIVLDLYRFFKYSTKRIHDYFDIERFSELQGHRMLKHVSTRWIHIQDVLI